MTYAPLQTPRHLPLAKSATLARPASLYSPDRYKGWRTPDANRPEPMIKSDLGKSLAAAPRNRSRYVRHLALCPGNARGRAPVAGIT